MDNTSKLNMKLEIFEYFVLKLFDWKKSKGNNSNIPFTKLQLQKLLFLTSASNSTDKAHGLLDIFDNFYALQYGPVEMDVYHAMSNDYRFKFLTFENRECTINYKNQGPLNITNEQKFLVDSSIDFLRKENDEYVNMEAYKLVNITHGWTVWQVAMATANLLDSKMGKMSTIDIINSNVKIF